MDIERAFRAPFADAKWYVKTAWAGLWSGLGVTAPAVSGYTLDYIRNVAYGYETPLPEWNEGFGRWWVRGFLATLAGFIYMLPALVLLILGMLPVIGAAASSNYYGYSQAAAAAALFGGGAACLVLFIVVAYTAAVSVFFYGAYVNYALSEDFASLFRFREILARLRSEGSGYFAAWGMSIVFGFGASFVAGMAGSVLGATGVLMPLAGFVGGAIGFVAAMMTAHLFGQYAARAYGLPGLAPLPVAPAPAAASGYAAPPSGYAPPQPTYAPQPYAQQPYAPQPPVYPPQAPQPPYYPPAAPQPPAYSPPAPPAPPAGVATATPAPEAAPAPDAPSAPEPPDFASSANSVPGSPMPPYSPEQAASPSGPEADPPAEDGDA